MTIYLVKMFLDFCFGYRVGLRVFLYIIYFLVILRIVKEFLKGESILLVGLIGRGLFWVSFIFNKLI